MSHGWLLALVLLVSGCLGAAPPSSVVSAPHVLVANLPPGCNANAPAVNHGPAGAAVAEAPAVAVGCVNYLKSKTWEPTLGINPKNGHLFFYPSTPNPIPQGPISMGRSVDDGATWTFRSPTVGGQDTHQVSVDPYMYLDPSTGRIFADDLYTTGCSLLAFTDDEGNSWTNSATPCTQGDHDTIFAGKPVTSRTVGYPNVLYRCGINTFTVVFASVTTTCQKSITGGLDWIQTGTPAYVTDPTAPGVQGVPGWCDGGNGHGSTDKDGTVYLGKGLCGTPMVAISRDEGLTWTRSKISDLGMILAFCNVWDHEVNVVPDPSGPVYAFWVDNQYVPRLAISHDKGATWGAALDVRPPGVMTASMPQLAVGASGKIALAYLGSKNAPPGPYPKQSALDPNHCNQVPTYQPPHAWDNTTWDAYITVATDALDASPVFTTVTANDHSDPLAKGWCELHCNGTGDFIDVEIAPDGTPWVALADACAEKCVPGAGPDSGALVGRMFGGPDLAH